MLERVGLEKAWGPGFRVEGGYGLCGQGVLPCFLLTIQVLDAQLVWPSRSFAVHKLVLTAFRRGASAWRPETGQ